MPLGRPLPPPAADGWSTVEVKTFGGGVNWTGHPAAIRDDEWANSAGFLAKDGYAESMRIYTQLGSTLGAGGFNTVGITQNPFSMLVQPILVGFVDPSTGTVKVYKVNQVTGAQTEITHDGTDTGGGAAVPKGHGSAVMGAAMLDGFLVLSFGGQPVGGSYSLVRILSTLLTYQTIKPTKVLSASFLASFGGHLLAAACGATATLQRTIKVSSSNSTSVWDSAVENSADEFAIGDATSPLLGLLRLGGNALGIMMRERGSLLSPTGALPPFTLHDAGAGGAYELADATADTGGGYVGETPFGGVYLGHDDLYLAGSGRRGIGRKVIGAIRSALTTGYSPELLWHPRLGVLLVPVGDTIYGYDPLTEAWSPTIFFNDLISPTYFRHAVIHDSSSLTPRHCLLTDARELFVEDLAGGPMGGFVDSKDFVFGDPPMQVHIGEVKVDWEPLTSATTDSIAVQLSARDDLSRIAGGGILGDSAGLIQPTMTHSLGDLQAGASELAARARGKICRFRFNQQDGRVRIRGFSFKVRPAGDRPAR